MRWKKKNNFCRGLDIRVAQRPEEYMRERMAAALGFSTEERTLACPDGKERKEDRYRTCETEAEMGPRDYEVTSPLEVLLKK